MTTDHHNSQPTTPSIASIASKGILISNGRTVIDYNDGRGTFWPADRSNPEFPIPEATVETCGMKIDIVNIEKCHANSTAHWHYSLKNKA